MSGLDDPLGQDLADSRHFVQLINAGSIDIDLDLDLLTHFTSPPTVFTYIACSKGEIGFRDWLFVVAKRLGAGKVLAHTRPSGGAAQPEQTGSSKRRFPPASR